MTAGARPAPVRIDDLADPRFSAETAEILTAMDAMAEDVRLEPDPLMDEAVAKTGLSDFGDDRFREPLDVLCTAFRAEAGLSGPGVVSDHPLLVQLLANRLLIQDLLRRHPEIHDVRIEAPIIVCGLPAQ